MVGGARDLLEDGGVRDGVGGGGAPGERAVAGDEDGGNGLGIAAREGLDDHNARRTLVAHRRPPRRTAGRVQGTSPKKWSAWVVPKQGSGRCACAQTVAHREWVWATPPISLKAR